MTQILFELMGERLCTFIIQIPSTLSYSTTHKSIVTTLHSLLPCKRSFTLNNCSNRRNNTTTTNNIFENNLSFRPNVHNQPFHSSPVLLGLHIHSIRQLILNLIPDKSSPYDDINHKTTARNAQQNDSNTANDFHC